MKVLRWCAPFVVLSCLPAPLWAKGVTTRIVIAGPGGSDAVEIADPKRLVDFVVWSGPGVEINGVPQTQGFIVDWSFGVVDARPARLTPYQVSFYVKNPALPLESQQEQLVYVVSYEPDFSAGQGYVYLPGKGDNGYTLNVRTIFRGREGNWFRATDAWNQLAAELIGRER